MSTETAVETSPPGVMAGESESTCVEIRRSGSFDLLFLEGDVGPEATGRLHEAALEAAGGKDVAIDWRRAGRVSAGAVQVLAALRKAVEGCGGALYVTGDNEAVRRCLELAGLSGLFPVREVGR